MLPPREVRMAYRELGMIEIREIIRRWIGGDGVRAIARGARVDRKTVVRYVAAAQAIGVVRGGPPVTDEQLTAVRRQATPEREPALSDEMQTLLPYRAHITRWLTHDELRLTKVHRRLGEQGVAVSYATLYRFARAHCDFGHAAVTVRVAASPPGEAAEVDFGFLGLWPDPLTGQRRRVHGLLITLCASRYAYLHVSFRQDLATVLEGLEAAWAFFGGVVRRVVVDNLTPVVTRADRYTPTLARVMLEYAQYRGFVVDPAVVRHATGKPKVERGIPYCRQDFFRGETFRDLTDMQARAVVWCRDLAGARLHGTTRQVPRVAFEAHEQAALLPLAPEPFDRPTWAWATVHPDHHLQFHRALYSVPTRYVGERVEVRGDARVVRIYHRGELIKLHAVAAPGHPATDYADYPAARVPYALRAPDACIRQAQQLGPALGQFVTVLLSATFPWSRLRQAQKLLRLAARYGAERVNAACARALAFELLDVRRVEGIIRAAVEPAVTTVPASDATPLPARFVRPPGSFTHDPQPQESHDGDRA
jgi:transposase